MREIKESEEPSQVLKDFRKAVEDLVASLWVIEELNEQEKPVTKALRESDFDFSVPLKEKIRKVESLFDKSVQAFKNEPHSKEMVTYFCNDLGTLIHESYDFFRKKLHLALNETDLKWYLDLIGKLEVNHLKLTPEQRRLINPDLLKILSTWRKSIQ